ncbi:MAG: FG-GAP-like repeat-containing protein [Bacteroidota bacterium]
MTLRLISFFFLGLFFFSCQSPPQKDGATLAKNYCSSCHQFPEPDLLDKATWQQEVLPRMGQMMGRYDSPEQRAELLESEAVARWIEARGLYPPQPTISAAHWQQIEQYYAAEAPGSLPQGEQATLSPNLPHFQFRTPNYQYSPPSTTLIDIREAGGLWMGDANSTSLTLFSAELELQGVAQVKEGAVSLTETQDAYGLTVMGSFSPTDEPSGFLMALPKTTDQAPQVLISDLQRPVHSDWGDVNQDGLPDVLIAEFAKWSGGLSWWELRPDGAFEEHRLSDRTGAIKAYWHDLDQDGQEDVVALFGQAQEGIYWYQVDSSGQWTEHPLVEFPPSYGSSSLRLWDADGDGDSDLLYTAGDNADYQPILKPYHGVYLFENFGEGKFEEKWFLPLNGAYDAIPADFDQDGDMDLAAISFFPDFDQQAQEGFVYFQNQGDFQFAAHTFPEVSLGRWLVMDVGDVDQDGDQDIALGSLTFEVIGGGNYVDTWVANGIPFVILENTTQP